jgi:hypothetical protein
LFTSKKWLWRYGLGREVWWKVVVDSKYGSLWGGWCSSELVGAYGVGLWKIIRRGWEKFSSHTRVDVGDDSNVRFWNDLWSGDMALKEAFPVLMEMNDIWPLSLYFSTPNIFGQVLLFLL